MIYRLTSEQDKKNRNRSIRETIIVVLVLVGAMGFFSFLAIEKNERDLPQVLMFYFMLLLVGLFSGFWGMREHRKKKVFQVETNLDSFALLSGLNCEESTYASIEKLIIQSDPKDNVVAMLLKINKKPFLFLKGYEDMTRFAAELESKIQNSDLVIRVQKKEKL